MHTPWLVTKAIPYLSSFLNEHSLTPMLPMTPQQRQTRGSGAACLGCLPINLQTMRHISGTPRTWPPQITSTGNSRRH